METTDLSQSELLCIHTGEADLEGGRVCQMHDRKREREGGIERYSSY